MSARKFKPGATVDFVVIGSGAAGGTIARELSRAGLDVVVLEQGPRYTPADFQHDEFANWIDLKLSNDLERNPQTFRQSAAEVAKRVKDFPAAWYAPNVGGSTSHFTANYWRLHEVDFDERSRIGAIPGTTFADWPISYAELEPYYTKVEWEVGVSGLAGASPFDPPRSKPYPMPPLPVKSSGVLLERGARKLGLHPFPAPMAIASVPYRGRAACAHCGFCIGFGCEMQAKSGTMFTMIPEAEATGHCEVRPLSYVTRIETNAAGRTTGVVVLRPGQARAFPEGPRRRRLRQRGRDAAPAAQLGQRDVPAGPRELERHARQEPDVQHLRPVTRAVRARTERVQERAGHAHRARLVRSRSEARVLWWRWPRWPHRTDAAGLVDVCASA